MGDNDDDGTANMGDNDDGEWETQHRRQRQTRNQNHIRDSTTFFVTNLPGQCSLGTLWKEFRGCGKMTDAYLPRRRDKYGKFFAFIRFEDVKNKEAMVSALNNISIGEFRVRANLAKFGKEDSGSNKFQAAGNRENSKNQDNGKEAEIHKVWRPVGDQSFKNMLTGERESAESNKVVTVPEKDNPKSSKVVTVPENFFASANTWRGCSLIGRARDVSRLCRIGELIKEISMTGVSFRYIGGLRVMMSFSNSADAISFCSNKKDEWTVWFTSLELWQGQIFEFERIAWLKISGVPIQLWDKEIFNLIAENFGELVHGSLASVRDGNLASESVGVMTKDGKKIVELIELRWKGDVFRVWVEEVDLSWNPDFVAEPHIMSLNLEDGDQLEEGEFVADSNHRTPVGITPVHDIAGDDGKRDGHEENGSTCLGQENSNAASMADTSPNNPILNVGVFSGHEESHGLDTLMEEGDFRSSELENEGDRLAVSGENQEPAALINKNVNVGCNVAGDTNILNTYNQTIVEGGHSEVIKKEIYFFGSTEEVSHKSVTRSEEVSQKSVTRSEEVSQKSVTRSGKWFRRIRSPSAEGVEVM